MSAVSTGRADQDVHYDLVRADAYVFQRNNR
jgi:hypothetical protein